MTDPNHLADPARIVPGNVPPSDLDAEGVALSLTLLVHGNLDRCRAVGLQPQHFYADANRRIWESILNLDEGRMEIDIVAVAGDLRHHGRLDQIGGTPYLAVLAAYPVEHSPSALEQHCRTIIACWRARSGIARAQTLAANLYHPGGAPYDSLLAEHEQQIWEINHENRETTYELAGDIAHRALHELGAALRNGGALGTSTGFSDLDKKVGGYQPGQLIIIAARTGLGKSSFLTSSLLRSSRVPKDGSLADACYIESLEMPREEVSLRLVCIEADVEFQKMRMNQLTQRDWDMLFRAGEKIASQPLLIGDSAGMTVQDFRSRIRKIQREIALGRLKAKTLAVAAVDYIQLMTGEKGGGRELEVSSLSRNLKATAKSEKVCVVGLAQVNRESEKKTTDKRPRLDNLRESGALENDADAVWFLYRDKYYNKDANDEAEVIIAKQRGGATGTVLVAFDGPTISFRPLARGYEDFNDFGDAPGAQGASADPMQDDRFPDP